MNKLLETIKCANCSNIFSSPVTLPCGHSVCERHIDQITQSVVCNRCGIVHANCIYSVNFLANEIVAQIREIDLGPCHKQARKSCENLNVLVSQIGVILKDPDAYIYEMFSEIKTSVYLQYEEYKTKLDQELDKILAELNRLENECKQKAKHSNMLILKELVNANEAAQNDLNSYLNALNELQFDEDKWKGIQQQCDEKLEFLQEKLSNFTYLLTDQIELNTLDTEMFNVNIELLSIFESKIDKFKSKILTNSKLKKDLLKLCEIGSKVKFTLLYRGTRDGFGVKDFRSKCDGKAKTLTIIKSTSECIFGGYAEIAWYCNTSYKKDPNAYLFSLINKENQPLKMNIESEQVALVFNVLDSAPVFGDGYDLRISNNSNLNKYSYSRLSGSFRHPKYEFDSEKAKTFLAGTHNFQVAEIEVFQLVY